LILDLHKRNVLLSYSIAASSSLPIEFALDLRRYFKQACASTVIHLQLQCFGCWLDQEFYF